MTSEINVEYPGNMTLMNEVILKKMSAMCPILHRVVSKYIVLSCSTSTFVVLRFRINIRQMEQCILITSIRSDMKSGLLQIGTLEIAFQTVNLTRSGYDDCMICITTYNTIGFCSLDVVSKWLCVLQYT